MPPQPPHQTLSPVRRGRHFCLVRYHLTTHCVNLFVCVGCVSLRSAPGEPPEKTTRRTRGISSHWTDHNRTQWGSNHVFSNRRKTRRAGHSEQPACRRRAYVCRASAYFSVSRPDRKPLDAFAQTAGVSFRIRDALWAGRSRAYHLPYQHDGHAYTKFAGGPALEPLGDAARRHWRSHGSVQSHVGGKSSAGAGTRSG